MKKFKLTNNREKELKIIEWFIPTHCDWKHPHTVKNDGMIGIVEVSESPDGLPAEEAFFMKSETGKFPEKVLDKPKLRSLLWGKIWRERHIGVDADLWMGGIKDGTFSLSNFEDEPPEIYEFVKKFFEQHRQEWLDARSNWDWQSLLDDK